MNGTRNRRLIVLGVASALAMVGLVWLGLRVAHELPRWMPVAFASPLAVKCLALMGGGLVLLAAIALALLRLREKAAAAACPAGRRFNADQGGTAAIEMALLFPFALMIFLVIIQAALLFNANMVVYYSGFAAARMAAVIIPQYFAPEEMNMMLPDNDPSSPKLAMIRRAAVLALVPVSAQAATGTGDLDPVGSDVDTQTRGVFGSQGGQDQHWFGRVKAQYNYANANTKVWLSPPAHWSADGNPDPTGVPRPWTPGVTNKAPDDSDSGGFSTQDPDPTCPYYYNVNGTDWNGWQFNQIHQCIGKHHGQPPDSLPEWDYWYWEDLFVWVRYAFSLEVPYANRFLGDSDVVSSGTGTQYVTKIRVVVALSNEGGTELFPTDYVQP